MEKVKKGVKMILSLLYFILKKLIFIDFHRNFFLIKNELKRLDNEKKLYTYKIIYTLISLIRG